jgi:hypothetical protein
VFKRRPDTRITAVLHTWGSTMTHHPHVHMIVPGGGIALDGKRWLSCQPRLLLPVPVLTKLFQGRMLAKLLVTHKAGLLQFFGQHAHLAERKAFAAYLALVALWPFGSPLRGQIARGLAAGRRARPSTGTSVGRRQRYLNCVSGL